MKKIFVSVLALLMIFALAGCGDMRVSETVPTAVPYVTADPDDGMVYDRDGIITDNDSGRDTETDSNTTANSGMNSNSGRRIGTIDNGTINSGYDK